MKKIIILSIMLLLAACNREIVEPISEPDSPDFPAAPLNVELSLGDKMLVIDWQMTDTSGIATYPIYRAEYLSDIIDLSYELIDSSASTSYTDNNLINGRLYYYRIAAVSSSGVEGYKSAAVYGVPDLFSIVINNGEDVTATRQVTLSIIASTNAVSMMISNNSDFSGASWENITTSRSWTLSSNAGEKTVYARFRDYLGNLTSGQISDNITYEIQGYQYSILANGGDILTYSRNVNLTINAPQGTTYMKISDRDDYQGSQWEYYGANKSWYISPDIALNGETVSFYAVFRDATGDSVAVEATDYIVLANAEPVVLLPVTNMPDNYDIIELQWSRSMSEDFYIYRVFRSMGNSDVDTIVATIGEATQTQYFDTLAIDDLPESEIDSVYYTVRFYSEYGDSTDSDTILVTLSNLVPDEVSAYIGNVTYTPQEGGGLNMTATLGWSMSSAPDFDHYIIYENTVNNSGTAVPIFYEYDKLNLNYSIMKSFDASDIDSLDYEYYYWLKIIDAGGLESDFSDPVNITE